MKILNILFFMLLTSLLSAQYNPSSYLYLGGKIGACNYFGDMDSGDLLSDLLYTSPAFSLTAGYQHNRRFGTQLSLTFGGIKGDDSRSTNEGRSGRNLSFHSPYYELALMEEFFIMNPNGAFKDGFKINVKSGVAGFFFNPKTKDNNGVDVELQPLRTEGQGTPGYPEKYSLYRLCIPFGGSIGYQFNGGYSVGMELLSRFTFFDYLDDLSKNYVPSEVLLANGGRKAVELSDRREKPLYSGQRGDKNDDYVFTYMLYFRYNIGSDGIRNPE